MNGMSGSSNRTFRFHNHADAGDFIVDDTGGRIHSNITKSDTKGKTEIQKMDKQMNNLKIPQTDSIKELTNFWDRHDLTDFEDQLEEVNEQVFEKQNIVRINLKPKEVAAVKELAKSREISYIDLIREWIIERIHL